MDGEALTALAFGPDAGSSDSIPRDGSRRQRLLAAIVLGARGRYAAAADLLDPLRRGRDPLLASLAASTLASHRRQLGAHEMARKLDGEALLAVGLRGEPWAGDGSRTVGDGLAAARSGSLGGGLRSAAGGVGAPAGSRGRREAGLGGAGSGAGSPAVDRGSRGSAAGSGRVGTGAGSSAGGVGSRRAGSGRTNTEADSPVADMGSHGPAPGSRRASPNADSPPPVPAAEPPAPPSAPGAAASPGSPAPADDPHGLDLQGARADALLGLAADNLALGRISAARRLAVRAAQADRRWRATVRGGWVGAEIELADGQPEAAVAPARLAYETAVARQARRHIVKSGIVLGVALLAAGRDGARELVVAAAVDAERYELNSLSWVADRVAADLDHDRAEEYRFRSRQVLHAVLRHADPCVMRVAHESPWVPVGPG